MKTWQDLWEYLCDNGFCHSCSQFWVTNPNEIAKAFWNGMLCVLESEGKVTKEDANNIWNEIERG